MTLTHGILGSLPAGMSILGLVTLIRTITRGGGVVRYRVSRACLLVLPFLGACQGTPRTAVTVKDSAGVRITITHPTDRTYATIDSIPVLSLGGPQATGPAQFYQIQTVHLDPSGALWVVDGQTCEIRLFQSSGVHLATVGGRGEGPGEFLRPRLLGPFRGDSVAVWDDANGRLSVFSPGGVLVRTEPAFLVDGVLPRAMAVFNDGSILAQTPRILSAGSLEPGALLGDSVHLIRLDPGKPIPEPMAEARGPTWVWTGRSQVPLAFTINAGFEVDQDGVYVVAGPDFRVRLFQRGRLSESFGVDRAPRRVVPEDIAAYVEVIRGYMTEPMLSEYLAGVDHPNRPGFLPAYSRVLVSGEGRVWARIYSADVFASAHWDVFSPDREWEGRVDTPAGVTVTEVTGGSMVGVWRDELDVEYVRVYAIRAGGLSPN
jgi:hypothetical protein